MASPCQAGDSAGGLSTAGTQKLASRNTSRMRSRPARCGAALRRRAPTWMVLRPPAAPQGPRRVGIQVGHWKTEESPPELAKLIPQTGAIWEGLNEVDVNLNIADRVAALLRRQGI